MHPALARSYAKIERAEKHVNEIESLLAAFRDTNPYALRLDYNDQARLLSLVVTDCKPLPDTISVVIGEAFHQLRSALDHVMEPLIIAHTGERPPANSKPEFPIFFQKDRFERAGMAKIKGVAPAAQKRIISVQPFHRGDPAVAKTDPLWIVHAANNIDKHRLLLTIQSALGGQVRIDMPRGVVLEGPYAINIAFRGAIENNMVVASFITDQRTIDGHIEMAIQVALNEIGLANNEPAIPLLTQLSGYVRNIVASFERFLD